MAKAKRAPKFSPQQIKEIILEFQKWNDEQDFPSVSGFLSQDNIRHKYKLSRIELYNNEKFSPLLADSKEKCENYLIKQALRGVAIPSAIFLLKQLQYGGYADKQELDLSSKAQAIKFISVVPRPKKG